MLKSRMKQRVAVALATVWLASIVGASVPSGETTTFSTTPLPPGPSSDQYTPLLGNPRYYPQDDYNQDWMNDEPSRIKVANSEGKWNSDRDQTSITNSDRSLPKKSSSNEFLKEKTSKTSHTPYHVQLNDKKILNKFDKEAMRLASMKLAFDDPIETELSDKNNSQEDWTLRDDIEEDDVMQQDEFVSDNTFEDEGPGSVEIYKLDLYKDRPMPEANAKPSKKFNYKNLKSKPPKKVGTIDQRVMWGASQDTDDSKRNFPETISIHDHESQEFFTSLKPLKERIFGVGGVPELQVGCEGAEAFQRQKRSDASIKSPDTSEGSNRGSQLYLDLEYEGSDEDEELDLVGGTDELFKILRLASTTTESTPIGTNRGDMDPRVKTPADLAASKSKRKYELPTRGDLGPEGDPNLNDETVVEKNNPQSNTGRKLLSLEENMVETKNEGLTNEHGHHKHRGRRHGGGTRRRRRQESKRENKNWENELKRRRNLKSKKNRLQHSRKSTSNLLRQLSTGREARNARGYDGRSSGQDSRLNGERKRLARERRISEENRKKLQDYRRRNTPIPRTLMEYKKPMGEYISRATYNKRMELQKPQEYQTNMAEYLREMEVKKPDEDHTNMAEYEKEFQRYQNDAQQSTERPTYQKKSPKEIARLKALPVTAQIIIRENKPRSSTPEISSRWNDNEISYPGLSPTVQGREVAQFPAPATSRPTEGPTPCVWAIMTCCKNKNRLPSCFETTGCTGAHWDPDPCSEKNMAAAIQMVTKYTRG